MKRLAFKETVAGHSTNICKLSDMPSSRKALTVDYKQLHSLSFVVLCDTATRSKHRGRFYDAERIITRRKCGSVKKSYVVFIRLELPLQSATRSKHRGRFYVAERIITRRKCGSVMKSYVASYLSWIIVRVRLSSVCWMMHTCIIRKNMIVKYIIIIIL